jgi:beta-lactam-binding protein with PASTA domain
MNIKDFLWPLPFLSFWCGYYLLSSIYTKPTVTTPSLIGSNLVTAIQILSSANLNPRILAQKIDPNLPDGMILSQTPAAHQQIKIGQPVYLVISQKPDHNPTPDFMNLSHKKMIQVIRKQNIHEKIFYVLNHTFEDIVIGQSPLPGIQLKNDNVIIYYPQSPLSIILTPDLRKKTIKQVKHFCEQVGINLIIEQMNPQKKLIDHNALIIKQKPIAKTFLNMDKKRNITVWID